MPQSWIGGLAFRVACVQPQSHSRPNPRAPDCSSNSKALNPQPQTCWFFVWNEGMKKHVETGTYGIIGNPDKGIASTPSIPYYQPMRKPHSWLPKTRKPYARSHEDPRSHPCPFPKNIQHPSYLIGTLQKGSRKRSTRLY